MEIPPRGNWKVPRGKTLGDVILDASAQVISRYIEALKKLARRRTMRRPPEGTR